MPSIADHISAYNRRRKWRLFRRLVDPKPETSILDVGFSDREYAPSDNFLEKHYPYGGRITALGIDASPNFAARYPEVDVVTYDGRDFPFPDKSFDICWSNAVIEHVGGERAQAHFLGEIARVARTAFISTPNRLFPIEVHTRTPLLHLLPRRLFEAYLRRIGKEWACGDYMHLLSERDLRRLLERAGIRHYRVFRNYLAMFVLDFVILLGESGEGGFGTR